MLYPIELRAETDFDDRHTAEFYPRSREIRAGRWAGDPMSGWHGPKGLISIPVGAAVRRGVRDLRGLNSGRSWPMLALIAAALGGCSTNLTKAPEVKPLDPTLFPAQYKREIADFMRTYLSNPTKVKDAFVGEPVMRPVDKVQQYITCVRYNPRDSKEQYLGTQTNLAIFLGGRLIQFLPGDPKMCAGLNYQRFPEVESMVP
jgi:hypothetical protein